MSGLWKAALKARGGAWHLSYSLTSGFAPTTAAQPTETAKARRAGAGAAICSCSGSTRRRYCDSRCEESSGLSSSSQWVVSLARRRRRLRNRVSNPMRKRRWRTACRNAECASSQSRLFSSPKAVPDRPSTVPPTSGSATGRCVRAPGAKRGSSAPLPPQRSKESHGVSHGRPFPPPGAIGSDRSEEHTSELQSPDHLVCRLLLEKKKPTLRLYNSK